MLAIFRNHDDERDALVQDLAKKVARITRTGLKPEAANMNVAELRGYLRTRTAREAKEQVRRALVEVRMTVKSEAELTVAVAERAIHLVIRDLMVSPTVSIPLPHVQTRAA
jgi:hypothetical protein